MNTDTSLDDGLTGEQRLTQHPGTLTSDKPLSSFDSVLRQQADTLTGRGLAVTNQPTDTGVLTDPDVVAPDTLSTKIPSVGLDASDDKFAELTGQFLPPDDTRLPLPVTPPSDPRQQSVADQPAQLPTRSNRNVEFESEDETTSAVSVLDHSPHTQLNAKQGLDNPLSTVSVGETLAPEGVETIAPGTSSTTSASLAPDQSTTATQPSRVDSAVGLSNGVAAVKATSQASSDSTSAIPTTAQDATRVGVSTPVSDTAPVEQTAQTSRSEPVSNTQQGNRAHQTLETAAATLALAKPLSTPINESAAPISVRQQAAVTPNTVAADAQEPRTRPPALPDSGAPKGQRGAGEIAAHTPANNSGAAMVNRFAGAIDGVASITSSGALASSKGLPAVAAAEPPNEVIANRLLYEVRVAPRAEFHQGLNRHAGQTALSNGALAEAVSVSALPGAETPATSSSTTTVASSAVAAASASNLTAGGSTPLLSAAAQGSHSTPPAGVTEQVREQVVQFAARQQMNQDVLRLQLQPVELGMLEIELQQSDTEVSLVVTARESHTRELLEAGVARLRAGLQEAGLTLADVDIRQEMEQQRDPRQAPLPSSNRKAEPGLSSPETTGEGGVHSPDGDGFYAYA